MTRQVSLVILLLSSFVLGLKGQQLEWLIDPSDFFPPDITIQYNDFDCTNEFDMCLWQGIEDGGNVSQSWSWEALEGVHWQGGADVEVVYNFVPCSEAVNQLNSAGQTPIARVVPVESNSILSEEVCISITDKGDNSVLEYCFNLSVQCGSCGFTSNIFCSTCEEASQPLANGGCRLCDPIDLVIGYESCTPPCTDPSCPIQGPPQPQLLCDSPGFVPHNMSWFAFIASEEQTDIEVFIFNCVGAGVQSGIYQDCSFDEPCVGFNVNCTVNSTISYDAVLDIGSTYYMFVDGCNGSECEYEITIDGLNELVPDDIDHLTAYSSCQETFLTDDFSMGQGNASESGACDAADRIFVCPGDQLQFGVRHQGNIGNYPDNENPCDEYYLIDASFLWSTSWGEFYDWNPLDEGSGEFAPLITMPTQEGIYGVCLDFIDYECFPVLGPKCIEIEVQSGLMQSYYLDNDGDGHGAGLSELFPCMPPSGYSCSGDDCDDNDPNNFPGNSEDCDGQDNNCNGEIDEGLQELIIACADSGFDFVAFEWNEIQGAVGYSLVITINNSSDPIIVNDYTSTEFQVVDLNPGDEVVISVFSIIPNAVCLPSSEAICVAESCTDFPTLAFEPCAEFSNKIIFSWDAIVGINNYEVIVLPSTSGMQQTETSFTVDNLQPMENVSIVVRPIHPMPECSISGTAISCSTIVGIDNDGDGSPEGEDCDDNDPNNFPGNDELCDGQDNNCNNDIDEGLEFLTYYSDLDRDGYGVDSTGFESCLQPPDTTTEPGDCDDNDPAVNPGVMEVPGNDIDENCDGIIGTVSLDDHSAKERIRLYPNPTTGYVFLDTKFQRMNYQLYTVRGEVVGTGQILENRIDLKALDSGIYIVILSSNDKKDFFYDKLVKL